LGGRGAGRLGFKSPGGRIAWGDADTSDADPFDGDFAFSFIVRVCTAQARGHCAADLAMHDGKEATGCWVVE